MSNIEFRRSERLVWERVKLWDPTRITGRTWLKADDFTAGIDAKDTPYVALALHLGAPLWTGDLKLSKGLGKHLDATDVKIISTRGMLDVHFQ